MAIVDDVSKLIAVKGYKSMLIATPINTKHIFSHSLLFFLKGQVLAVLADRHSSNLTMLAFKGKVAHVLQLIFR